MTKLPDLRKLVDAYQADKPNVSVAAGFVHGTEIEYFHIQCTDENRFEIGSVSKLFTAILASQSLLAGKFELDDPLAKYVPGSSGTSIRSLLTHTSGLHRLPIGMIWSGEVSSTQPYARWSQKRVLQALRWDLRLSRGKFRYSNFGYAVLGLLLQKVNGQTYGELLKEWCRLHDMRNTTIDSLPYDLPGHLNDGEGVPSWAMNAFASAGGVRSTLADMLHFAQIGMSDEPSIVLSQTTVSETSPASPLFSFQKKAPKPAPAVQGLGWQISRRLNGEVLWHNGGMSGSRSFIGINRSLQLGVVVLANSQASVDPIGFNFLDSFPP